MDHDNAQITLGSPLTGDAALDDMVLIWDGVTGAVATELRATVFIPNGADAQGDTIDCRVALALVPLLPEGMRDTGAGEAAQCTEQDGEWVLTDLPGMTPQLRGELVTPGSIQMPSLGFTLPSGNKVTTGSTAPASAANGDLWIYTNASDPTQNTIFVWSASATAWQAQQVGSGSIAANSITASQIAANAVVAANIAAGALDAQTINAGSLTAGSLSSGNIGSSVVDSSEVTDTQFVLMDTDDSGGAILLYTHSGQTIQTVSTPGAGSFTVPAGVAGVKVECWGGGGAGQGTAVNGYGGQGGGGGEYARENNYAVTPGAVLPYVVGAGGTSSAGQPGTSGGATSFDSGAVAASGGIGGNQQVPAQYTGAPGGSGSTDSVHFSGGAGHNAINTVGGGGGGGSSAGNAKAGATGGAPTPNPTPYGGAGGAAPSGGARGGTGGNGGSTGASGGAAAAPGGGGGGAGAGSTARAGGAGGAGQLRLSYGGSLTLIASIAAAAGVDQYGNAYPAGVKIATAAGGNDKAFNVVGATSQPAYQNGWTSYDTTTYPPARFYKDALGVVHLSGLVKSGTPGSGSTIFTLPIGYRPGYALVLPAISNNAFARAQVNGNGNVVAYTGSSVFFSLDGISFLAEQ